MTTNDHNVPAPEVQQPTLCDVRSSGGMGSLLRSIAGTPAGWRPTRRGSFLVLVVGTLALLAVMAILYSSIGNHDVRMKAAVAKHDQLNDAPEQIKNYLLSIIGDSVTATYYDTTVGMPAGKPLYLSRVTFDYPSTSYFTTSDNIPATLNANSLVPFSPTGSVSGFLGTPDYSQNFPNQVPRSWQPTAPWLASNEPTFLNFAQATHPAEERHWYRRDWAHISNVSPDGRFINLVNLRNNFQAKSGFGASEMNDNVGWSFPPNNGPLSNQTDFGRTIIPSRPAHLDSRQAWLFRPARPSGTNNPGSARYEPYLFADADGDGMFDSRWQELVDGRNGVLKNYLDVDPRFRYAVAVRIIDLSGNINVNTATDSTFDPSVPTPGPQAYAPAGVSPSEVDLRRLLTGQVPFEVAGVTGGVGLDAIHQPGNPPNPTNPANYSGMVEDKSFLVGHFAYQALRMRLASGISPPPEPRYAGTSLALYFPGLASLQGTDYQFDTVPQKRWEYYNQTSRAMLTASLDTSGASPQFQFQGSFGLDDLQELVTRRAVNDPSVTSSLELTLGGRDTPAGNGSGSFPDRHSPLRSNRDLDVELKRYTTPAYTAGSDFDRTMTFFNADIRQRLTTVSGGRPFRDAPSVELASGQRSIDPYRLGKNELRIDPKVHLAKIREIDTQLNAPTRADQLARHMATNAIFHGYLDALAPRLGYGDVTVDSPWNSNGFMGGPRATEFYGYRGPELAMRVAAHMTVNLIDAFDRGRVDVNSGELIDLPTVHTLVLDRNMLPALDAYTPTSPEGLAFGPWKNLTSLNANETRALQLPANLLGDSNQGHPINSPAINVFGVEAQPFITQVASFTVYADAHRSSDPEDPTGPAEIDGSINFTNPDLLYRVVAFQLHNPFDAKIQLSGHVIPNSNYYNVTDPGFPELDREQSYFYLKFNDRAFKLAALEQKVYVDNAQANRDTANNVPSVGHPDADQIASPPTGPQPKFSEMFVVANASTYGREPITLAPIEMDPGETIVVYTLSDTPKNIMERFSDIDQRPNINTPGNFIDSDVPGVSGGYKYKEFRNIILDAIEVNLGRGATGAKTYWIPEIGGDGKAVIPDKTDYVSTVAGSDDSVQLWRALRSGDDARTEPLRNLPNRYWSNNVSPRPGGPASIAFVQNKTANDQLIDRFRISDRSILDTKLNGVVQITGSDSTDDSKLFTLTKWAAFARNANPGGKPPLGALPGYCLEPKYAAATWNKFKNDGYATLSESDFGVAGDSPFGGAAEDVEAWLVNMSRRNSTIADNTIAEGPDDLLGPFPSANIAGTVDYKDVYPEIIVFNNDMEVTLPSSPPAPQTKRVLVRPADLLLPLGIGPEEMPVNSSGNLVTDLYERWTTLGEAVALALGYQTNPPPPPGTPDVTTAVYEPLGTDPNLWPLDRGNLRLNYFAPFIDGGTPNGTFELNTDIRVGLQVPLALNVLDTFTVNPVDPEAANWETLKRATPGTVNINTISQMTLHAAFPMLSPPPAYPDPLGRAQWWWDSGPLDERADIASSVLAYRDRTDVEVRPSASLDVTRPVRFNMNGGAREEPNLPDNQLVGRAEASQIPGLHESPGFRSLGELLAVRFGGSAEPSSMDFLGRDQYAPSPGWVYPTTVPYGMGASGRAGIDSVLYTNPSGANAPKVPSNIPNSYKEQLAIINSVLPSMSTRSDYFCVWFLVHGYQKSDCEGLGDNDPLVPSIARRFVMVVDRSKVTKKGDLPEVLLFKEVPVDPMPR